MARVEPNEDPYQRKRSDRIVDFDVLSQATEIGDDIEAVEARPLFAALQMNVADHAVSGRFVT